MPKTWQNPYTSSYGVAVAGFDGHSMCEAVIQTASLPTLLAYFNLTMPSTFHALASGTFDYFRRPNLDVLHDLGDQERFTRKTLECGKYMPV
jgi:hypothetical protein